MKNTQESKYIYYLSHPGSNKYYVGQAFDLGSRYKMHLKSHKYNKKNKKDSWIKSLLDKNLEPEMHKICLVPKDQADFFEIMFIDLFNRLGLELVNGTLGGSSNSGGHTEETKRKISESNKGKKMSPEHNYLLHQVLLKNRKRPVNERYLISSSLLGNKFRTGKEPANKYKRKLTKEQVISIKNRLDSGESGISLSKEFSICTAAISSIKNNYYFSPRKYGKERYRDRTKNRLYLFS